MGEGQGLLSSLFSSVQGVSNDTSSLETERGFEELPLCSCRMEAPKIDRISERAGHKCMATESVDGEVGLKDGGRGAKEGQSQASVSSSVLAHPCGPQLSGCNAAILKRETMRPSSRVALMVLCETHRARMVKHHCCPGCGYFCTAVSDWQGRQVACPQWRALGA